MTCAAPNSFHTGSKHHSRNQHRSKHLEKSYRNCIGGEKSALTGEQAERRWFAGLLWKAFPEARSENDLAELVAEVLTTDKRPIHPKTVRNWLRCENSPHFRYVMKVLAMAGAESLFQIIDAEDAA